MKKLFSEEQIEFIISNYKTMTYKEIGEKLGYSERQIRGWVNHNCDLKTRQFKKDYFSLINTPNQAYWLGFIFADGWIHKDAKNRNYELGIELKSTEISS